MNRPERQPTVLNILENFRGLDPLKKLFWQELNYQRVNQPIPRQGWSDTASGALAEDPVLLAGAGREDAFHVIYARLASDRLLLGHERPVISRLLQNHPYALFVLSNKAQDRWHFVNVKYDDEPTKRRIFRRITIGAEERMRTASERLAKLDLASIGTDVSGLSPLIIQGAHDVAFDVEAVQKDFFKVFAALYHKVAEDIAQVAGLEKESGRLAQLLLDRLLFLYFIQKKGWLDQKSDYLYSRFQGYWKKDPKGHSYYADVLYPLFLSLSNPNTHDGSVGAVPFLNGGLFEESGRQSQAERLQHARVRVKNSTFKALFDDLLERFNFTVMEDTPLDVEVAIDPEMLGKIFESLILQLEKDPDKDLRKLTGSYYTPRAIVHFMCQAALTEHLATQLADRGDGPDLARQRVESLLALPPADHMDDDQLKTLSKLLSDAEAKLLRQSILDCRICDPAVGSGAFPVGILHELVAVVARLDLRLRGKGALARRNYIYDLKKHFIESCLYGVDIQEQAVRLCELRLWLSLIVDYQIGSDKPFAQAILEIPSLPNLSYRILRGDSLLERLFGHIVQLDEMARDAKSKQLIESIQADKQAYFREANTREKRRLELKILAKQADLAWRLVEAKRAAMTGYQAGMFGEGAMTAKDRKAKAEHESNLRDLEDMKSKIAKAKDELERLSGRDRVIERAELDVLRSKYFRTGDAPSFIWRVDFAEVFSEKGGFGIVLANPPYVSFGLRDNEAAAKKWDEAVRRLYPGSAEYKISVYALFLDLALKIAGDQGVVCYITPDSFLLGRYFSKLRRTILNAAAIKKVLMFEHDFWKSGVVGRPTISLFQRRAPGGLVTAILSRDETSTTSGRIKQYSYPQEYFTRIAYNRFRLFFSSPAMAYVEGLEARSTPLGNLARITTGVRSKSGQENVVATVCHGSSWKKGIVSGSQVLPYRVEWKGHYLNIDGKLLFAGGWDASIVERPKIMIRQTGDTIVAAIDASHLYHLNNVHSLSPLRGDISLSYLCAVLNSRLMNRYYHLVSLEHGRPMAQTDIETLELLPIKMPPPEVVERIESLVAKLRNRPDGDGLKREIDALIQEAYGLSQNYIDYLDGDDLYPEGKLSQTIGVA